MPTDRPATWESSRVASFIQLGNGEAIRLGMDGSLVPSSNTPYISYKDMIFRVLHYAGHVLPKEARDEFVRAYDVAEEWRMRDFLHTAHCVLYTRAVGAQCL